MSVAQHLLVVGIGFIVILMLRTSSGGWPQLHMVLQKHERTASITLKKAGDLFRSPAVLLIKHYYQTA
ncbi:MAG: hypothetical protein KDI21_00810 [Halieaceae bacterium]|nr:hypothetical protein [Halieaceae bacterium]